MNTLKLEKYNVQELNYTEIEMIDAGWCSFAYDIGTALRILFHSQSGPASGALIATDIAIYDAHCN